LLGKKTVVREIYMNRENKYKLFSELCLQACRQARIRKYSCKKSKHVYTQHQLITIHALMRYTKSHYRDIIDLIEAMDIIKEVIKLDKLPHFTTIQKFVRRFGDSKLDYLIKIQTRGINESILAVDASGFSSDNASKYYAFRIKGETLVKHYVKDTICIDVFGQMITSTIVAIGPKNDNKDFVPVLDKSKTRPVVVVADKGYDSEKNHRYVDSLQSVSMIPIKKNVHRGMCRKKMQRKYSDLIYHKRSVVETVFSVIKRKFGGSVYAKTDKMRIIEVCWLNFVYNLHRQVVVSTTYLLMISTEPDTACR
jgi:hypothetical protein